MHCSIMPGVLLHMLKLVNSCDPVCIWFISSWPGSSCQPASCLLHGFLQNSCCLGQHNGLVGFGCYSGSAHSSASFCKFAHNQSISKCLSFFSMYSSCPEIDRYFLMLAACGPGAAARDGRWRRAVQGVLRAQHQAP